MTRICQSCFDPECNHIQCYLETPEPTDEETTSTATFADLLRLHGSQLGNPFGTVARGDPLLKRRRAA